eukprot:1394555-Amorphochlora_amoeboformis.AAC.1
MHNLSPSPDGKRTKSGVISSLKTPPRAPLTRRSPSPLTRARHAKVPRSRGTVTAAVGGGGGGKCVVGSTVGSGDTVMEWLEANGYEIAGEVRVEEGGNIGSDCFFGQGLGGPQGGADGLLRPRLRRKM